MSDTAHQSPLGVNAVGSLLNNIGIQINPIMSGYVGSSTDASSYSLGSVCADTCLRLLVYSINDAYKRGLVDATTYNNLISIGSATSSFSPTSITSTPTTFTVTHSTTPISVFPVGTVIRIVGATPNAYNGSWIITASSTGTFDVASTINPDPATTVGTVYFNASVPALGDSMPLTYTWEGAPGWGGTLYNASNPVTQWGYIRLLALQAYNDFNYNNELSTTGGYKDFLASFNAAYSFIEYTNQFILSASNSRYFLDGTYSNMNDLITADLAGVSLASKDFGQDLINSGKAIDLSTIDTFGLPSNLLNTMQKNNAVTKSVTLALLAIGLDTSTLGDILSGKITPNTGQQKAMYDAFNIIVGPELQEVLVPLNVHTKGIESLADLLNPIKLFPNSYQSLTVPLYNTGSVG